MYVYVDIHVRYLFTWCVYPTVTYLWDSSACTESVGYFQCIATLYEFVNPQTKIWKQMKLIIIIIYFFFFGGGGYFNL